MNQKQKLILRRLFRVNGQKYSELYRFFEYEDKFPYHLKQLLKINFVEKKDGRYFLTQKGFTANTYFNDDLEDLQYKIPFIVFVCKYQDRFLIQEFFHDEPGRKVVYGLPGQKAVFGENLDTLCQKAILDKLMLVGEMQFRCIQNLLERNNAGIILFDNLFLVYDVEVTTTPEINYGHRWLTVEEIKSYPYRFSVVDDFILSEKASKVRELHEKYVIGD